MNTDGCAFDNSDEIDFGSLPEGVLGRACTTKNIGAFVPFLDAKIVEGDIRLNSGETWFRLLPSSCYDQYEIAGVLAHEFGHVFGMGHVDETDHGNLLMSTHLTDCSYNATLGFGDWLNMSDHY